MKLILALVFIIFTNLNLKAQTDYRKGSVYTLSGEVISGELNFQGDISNAQEIQFKEAEKEILYKPFDIDGYVFDGGKYYVSRKLVDGGDTTQIFAEYLVKGEKDLFFYRSMSGFHYAVSVSENEIVALPYKEEIVNVNTVNYQRESTRHIGYLKSYFSDCPSLYAEIERLEKPDRKKLIAITKEYHEITCGPNSCIVYQKKKHPFKMAVEPVYLHYLKPLDTETSRTFGMHLYFWLPNSSEKLYFKTGLLQSLNVGDNFYQFPFLFEYQYSYNRVKPKFSAGVNWYINEGGRGVVPMLYAGGGCLVKISNWLYLDLELGSDLFYFGYNTGLFETISTRTGLYIKF